MNDKKIDPETQKIIAERMKQMALADSEKRDQFDYFKCLTCGGDEEFSPAGFFKHLQEVHKLENPQGTQQMESHFDGSKWYQTNYGVHFDGGIEARRCTRNRRTRSTRI